MSFSTNARIAKLRGMLAARTRNGSPKPGYENNVPAIEAEIARLEGISKA